MNHGSLFFFFVDSLINALHDSTVLLLVMSSDSFEIFLTKMAET